MRLAVVGAAGQLGAAIVHECSPAHEVLAFDRHALDALDDRAVLATMERVRPDAIVNCAAYNQVDLAEDQPIDALNVNAFAVRALAHAAEQVGARLVHYSTDFVFAGTATVPYSEDDPPGPRSVYAASKLLGEWFALDAPGSLVLRVESLFGRAPNGPPSKGTIPSIASTILSGGTPKVFEDRVVSPTYIPDAARATRQLLETGAAAGLYHCVCSGYCTWYQFAEALARELGIEPTLTAVRVADVTLRAQRPQFCALSNRKLREAGVDMPAWQDALSRYVRDGLNVSSSSVPGSPAASR